MNIMTKLKERMQHAQTERAVRGLDNHILRDIGLPERDNVNVPFSSLYHR